MYSKIGMNKKETRGRKPIDPDEKVIQVDCGYFKPSDLELIGGKPEAKIIGRTAIEKKIKSVKKVV